MQYTFIHDAPRKRQHEFSVWDAAKVVGQVRVNDFPSPVVQHVLYLSYRLLGVAPSPVGILFVG